MNCTVKQTVYSTLGLGGNSSFAYKNSLLSLYHKVCIAVLLKYFNFFIMWKLCIYVELTHTITL